MIFIQALHEMLVLAPVKGATIKPNFSFGKKYPCKWHIILSFVNRYEQMELHVVGSRSKIHWYFFNCEHISTYLQITMGFWTWIFNVKKKFTFIYLFCIKKQLLHYEIPTFFIMCIIFGMMPNSHFCFTFIVSNILWLKGCFF